MQIFNLFIFIGYTTAQFNHYLDTRPNLRWYRQLRRELQQQSGLTAEDKRLVEMARRANKFQELETKPFPCKASRSTERPTTVHRLRPGDIDVIAAMGDSLTAANGVAATMLINLVVENRGLSWSGGGQSTWREFLTLPNILKEFNPKLFGYAIGDSLSIEKKSVFNVAEPIAMSRDLPHMAKELVRRIKNDTRVNFEKDWKLVSLMIGGNDMCSEVCYQQNPETYAETHRTELIKTFRYIQNNLPRTFLNFILMPNMETLIGPTTNTLCATMRALECSCLHGSRYNKTRSDAYMKSWQTVEKEVVSLPEFQKSDTFTVVLQNYGENSRYPGENTTDLSFLSADCFHFSQKMNARMANALWNNMLQPVGSKSQTWNDTFSTFLCPDEEHPFIYTSKNSLNSSLGET